MDKKRNRKKHKKIRKLNKTAYIFIAGFSVVALTVVHFTWRPIMSNYYQSKIDRPLKEREAVIQKGVLIDNLDLSRKNYNKALKYVNSHVKSDYEGTAFTIESSDSKHKYIYTFDDLDIKFNIENAVKSAVDFAQPSSKNYWREFKTLEGGTVNFPTMTYSRYKVDNILDKISKELVVPYKNATEKKTNDGFTVSEAQTGYSIDTDKIKKELYEYLNKKEFNKTIKFDITETKPKYFAKDFENADKLIGEYKSSYTTGDDARLQNLRTACSKIDGVVVYPDEEFSTNAHFNPCTEENGWANAGTIVKGKIEDSLGGGMCQVSSALYDAVLYAELEVTERHNHSMKVGYSPYAFDATLAGDYKDLKFKNTTGKPIYIQSYMTSSDVIVKIYGKEIHDESRTVELENKLIETIEPDEPIEQNDPELTDGARQVDVSARNGFEYELYKKVYENGQLKDTVKINTSIYSPRRQVTLIGTKKAEAVDSSAEN